MAETDRLRRHIGRQLQALRKRAGVTIKQAAAAADISESLVIRIEAGRSNVRFKDSYGNSLLKAYGATDDEAAVVMALIAETRTNTTTSWWHRYKDSEIPNWFSLYVTLEDGADLICLYQTELIPGLLQTPGYVAQVMSVPQGRLDDEEIQRRIDVRLERQQLLTRGRAPKVHVIMSEAAIDRVVRMSPQLARDQLQRLLDVTQRTNVIIQVIPVEAGAHAGMTAGSGFHLLHFPVDPNTNEPTEPAIAYVEWLTGAMYLDEQDETDEYERVWDDVQTRALDPAATRQLITNRLEGLPQ